MHPGGSVQKLLVVGNDQQRLNIIKSEVHTLLNSEINAKFIRPGYLQAALDSSLDLLVFDTNFINKRVFPFIVQLRKHGFKGAIIILGGHASNFNLEELNAVHNVYHLYKPYEPEQLQGLIKNCMNVEQMRKRRDQRFDVHEHATLEAYGTDFKAETTINNISRSGVRIEGPLGDLKTGDLLRLHFNFDKINKERIMSARVVWLKKDSDNKEEAGLEFVSQKDVYQYLLNYAIA